MKKKPGRIVDTHDKIKEITYCLGKEFGCKNALEIPALEIAVMQIDKKAKQIGAFICTDCCIKYRFNPTMNTMDMWNMMKAKHDHENRGLA